jgi:predicted acyl esterase
MLQPMIAARRPAALRAMFMNEVCTDVLRHLACFGGSINNRFFALRLGASFKDSDHTRTVAPWMRALASQVVNRPTAWMRS